MWDKIETVVSYHDPRADPIGVAPVAAELLGHRSGRKSFRVGGQRPPNTSGPFGRGRRDLLCNDGPPSERTAPELKRSWPGGRTHLVLEPVA
jgi:hypothetical protein